MANTPPPVGLWSILWSILFSFPFWEVIRIFFIGGPEYAEKRIPELLARLIANHQDESLLAGIISDWLRANFTSEDHIAPAYGIARFLKSRGGRFSMAAAEALEALPNTAHELRQMPAIRNAATPEERRALFGAAMSNKFNQVYAAAKTRLEHLPITHLNANQQEAAMPDRNSPPSESWLTRLSGLFSGAGGTAGNAIVAAGSAIDHGVRILGLLIALAGLYCLALVVMVFACPEWIEGIALGSFVIMVFVACVTALWAATRHGGSIIQGAIALTMALIVNTVLLLAFDIANIAQAVMMLSMSQGELDDVSYWCWLLLLAGLVMTLIWDRVGVAITQKLLNAPGVGTRLVRALLNDGRVDAAERAEIDLSNNIMLIDISITVGAVISVLWIILTFILIVVKPIAFPLWATLLLCEILLVGAYGRMGAKLHRKNAVQPHLQAAAEKWSNRIYEGGMNLTVYGGGIGLVIIMIWGVGYYMWRNATDDTTSRLTNVAASAKETTLEYVEEKIGTIEVPSPAEASQKASDLAAFGGESYCTTMAEQGMGDFYPCN